MENLKELPDASSILVDSVEGSSVKAPTRRAFLGSGGILLSCLVAGHTQMMSPRQAYAADVPLVVLSPDQASTLEAVAEAIVPGARKAGIVQFVDKQLSLELDQSLLMMKYLGVPAPFDGFYKSGLDALAQLSMNIYGKNWSELTAHETSALTAKVATNDVGGDQWLAPPAPFIFFVFRSDACDVVYGTEEGFDKIDMPYMAHITPNHNWK